MRKRMSVPLSVRPFIVFLVAFLASPPVYAHETNTTGANASDAALSVLRERIVKAEQFCDAVPIAPIVVTDPSAVTAANPSGKIITERPTVFCAYRASDDTWHAVTVYLPRPIPDSYKKCLITAKRLDERNGCVLPMRVATAGYDVERVGYGFGITRLAANIYDVRRVRHGDEEVDVRGERLTVYRTKHLWFDDAAIETGNTDLMLASMRAVYYTPYHPDFHTPDVVVDGERQLRNATKTAHATLRRRKVPSLAYFGQSVFARVPWQIGYALALIEQMDDLEFQEDPERTVETRFVDYALNGAETCRYCQSPAKALGLMQFTNNGKTRTYDTVVAKYPLAQLDPDFDRGARDHLNAMQAALCLIDLEVAQFPAIAPLFRRQPLLAGIYPVAAYNGGPGPARELFMLMRAGKISLKHAERVPQSIAVKKRCPTKKKCKPQSVVISINGETYGYVKKYIYVINNYVE